MDLLHRIQWETDAAGRLLVIDFGDSNKADANALFELFDATVRAEPEHSVRLLADFEGAWHAPDLTVRWKEAAAEHDKRIVKAAVTGVSGGIKVVISGYRFYLRLRGIDVDRKMRIFGDAGEARAWLALG